MFCSPSLDRMVQFLEQGEAPCPARSLRGLMYGICGRVLLYDLGCLAQEGSVQGQMGFVGTA